MVTIDHMRHLSNILAGFDIRGRCVNYEQHRHLAFYDVELEPGTTVAKLERRTREIALALKTKTAPIVKVISEKGIVRLHVATSDADTINLIDMFRSETFPYGMTLPFLLGENDEGKKLWTDFALHPHTLVAGGTGSGKSVFLHTLIANASVLNAVGYRDIEVYLADPKKVEFSAYKDPRINSLVREIAEDYNSTLAMLEYIQAEMEARYSAMAKLGVQNISECRGAFSYMMVIIDETADLMLYDKKKREFENIVIKLAQKARAAGIHIVLATQRPSRDILTGTIKANFPARIACKVSSRVDSQVILDSVGAEHLLGRGDAIIRNHANDSERFQVAYSDPKSIIANYAKFT